MRRSVFIIKPFWVEMGLTGINSRKSAVAWLNASIFGVILLVVITVAVFIKILETSLTTGFLFALVLGAIFSLSSVWYWSCIKWMDANKAWKA